MVVVDRAEMIAFSVGVLLDRCGTSYIAPNEVACEAAQNALDRGDEIALTQNHQIVSKMRLIDGEYREYLPGDEAKEH